MSLVVCSWIFISCEKGKVEPQEYVVMIHNNYFERIDSVRLSVYKINSIDVNHRSEKIILDNGNYLFSYISVSGLAFGSEVSIQGEKEKLQITIDKNGHVEID